jgi:galactokinase
VNLIGEHIDYAGLPVLPMALGREVRIAFRPRSDGTVRAVNLDARFPEEAFELAERIPRGEEGGWGNYLRAAGQAVVDAHGVSRGVDALVCSTLPDSAGLSSSSALVVAMAMALLEADDRGPSTPGERLVLADVLAEGERYTGTRGGGMDQAACLLARAGHACRVDFEPLRVEYLPIPDDWTFVVVHSGAEARKSGPVQEAYNECRREVEEALASVVAAVGMPQGTGYRALMVGSPPELVDLSGEVLDARAYPRFRHVVGEALRVEAACHAMRDADLQGFGRLMLESHESLRDDFRVSTPVLDRMVEAAMAQGAAGARLTGAGFGGCAVALSAEASAAGVLAAMSVCAQGRQDEPPVGFVSIPGERAGVGPLAASGGAPS